MAAPISQSEIWASTSESGKKNKRLKGTDIFFSFVAKIAAINTSRKDRVRNKKRKKA